jgi:hypothetical protein
MGHELERSDQPKTEGLMNIITSLAAETVRGCWKELNRRIYSITSGVRLLSKPADLSYWTDRFEYTASTKPEHVSRIGNHAINPFKNHSHVS